MGNTPQNDFTELDERNNQFANCKVCRVCSLQNKTNVFLEQMINGNMITGVFRMTVSLRKNEENIGALNSVKSKMFQ